LLQRIRTAEIQEAFTVSHAARPVPYANPGLLFNVKLDQSAPINRD
jgi:hypothetical protein